MKPPLTSLLRCPGCENGLVLSSPNYSNGEVESGSLACASCGATYPIVRFIPRFVSAENYAANFGFQWNRFQRTQLDSYTGTTISRERFLRQTEWRPEVLAGAAILDVGCGAGRFVEVALAAGARVTALDYSDAVDACWRNFGSHPNLGLVQADVYHLPFQADQFDYVYCFGVLQHTPDPHAALLALAAQLKPGGHLAVDLYLRHWKSLLHPKYLMRPITTRLPGPALFRAVERCAPPLLALSRAVARVPGVGRLLRRMVPVANYEGIYPLRDEHLREFAVLDTFDWLAPRYDQPQTAETLRKWLEEAGLEAIEVLRVFHLVGRGRKRAISAFP